MYSLGNYKGLQPYRVGFNFKNISRKDNVYQGIGEKDHPVNKESLWDPEVQKYTN